ncbi:WhiB family transcriptional regulator [Promicromonospora sp. NPDC050262]|uniref:WhiB family transcriptional regulator n=1 Tax=Promicromonospora sp. NPDC050262 TaxID=3155036 RepID=UPI0033ED38B8
MIASADQMRPAACARPENQHLSWISETAVFTERAAMAAVCAACPVLALCAREVATTKTTAGFWAGADYTIPDPPEQDTLPGLELPGTAAVGMAA